MLCNQGQLPFTFKLVALHVSRNWDTSFSTAHNGLGISKKKKTTNELNLCNIRDFAAASDDTDTEREREREIGSIEKTRSCNQQWTMRAAGALP